MASTLTLDRVRGDVDVLSRAGLDVATFVAEAVESIQRAVPHVASCLATFDPATTLLTGTFKFGDLYGQDDHDHLWGLLEYGVDNPTSFESMLRADTRATAMDWLTDGAAASVRRVEELLAPAFGYGDELRMIGQVGAEGWGGIALFRGPDDPPFSAADVEFMASLSAAYGNGIRAGILARHAVPAAAARLDGPTVVIVGADEQIRQMTAGSAAVLERLAAGRNMASATGILGSLVAGARRFASGASPTPPRARVRIDDGRWLLLHASPLFGPGGSGDVAITIEEARPPEIVPLVVAAFGLTARERDVLQLVLQGEGTKEIATALHVSRYTVQDHLKTIFDKADVRSRRELVARVYFDQYAERLGDELAPSGWFQDPTPEP